VGFKLWAGSSQILGQGTNFVEKGESVTEVVCLINAWQLYKHH